MDPSYNAVQNTIVINSGKVNFTSYEKGIVVNLIDRERDIVENRSNDSRMVHKKDVVWARITDEYNTVGGVSQRSVKSIKALWKNLKAKARNECKKAKEDNPGEESIAFSALTQKVISIILSVQDANDSMANNGDATVVEPSSASCDDLYGYMELVESNTQPSQSAEPMMNVMVDRSRGNIKLEAEDTSSLSDFAEYEKQCQVIKSQNKTLSNQAARVSFQCENGVNNELYVANRKRPMTPPTDIPTAKRAQRSSAGDWNGSDRFDRNARQMQEEEHYQRMKVMKLEQEILELKRKKLQKQIALLSSVNVFNMAMQ